MESEEATNNWFETLTPLEIKWRDRYEWLLTVGYQLRPRYKPGWTPSWKVDPRLKFLNCEDSVVNDNDIICDATRLKDQSQVVLKIVDKGSKYQELELHRFLSDESDTQNHAIPILEVLTSEDRPSEVIVVLPLCRAWDVPEFDTVGEVVDFIGQILEGFKFLHGELIAHRDIKHNNIVMEPRALYDGPFHMFSPNNTPDFKRKVTPARTRTQGRPRYYIIDFGLSKRYEASQDPPMEVTGIYGSDLTVPEFSYPDQPHNPFLIDVYCLGNMLKLKVLQGKAETLGFDWILPLLEDMINEDPTKRPDMSAVFSKFTELVKGLSEKTLRSQYKLGLTDLDWVERRTRYIPHWWRRIWFVATRTPPIPTFKAE
ncbi:kinase-like domain-containing protein [Ephemerocybe angulata]|uniref:Kinase-like domain-containing protein n=1 Tax=Ephemerocybe angulata TaxID=980116 RepID=A0A8H6HMN3_9AGAR|nr:kinase-like domain-containing protein [Tulosesus angulatus]